MADGSAVFSLQAHNAASNWVHCKAMVAGGVAGAASLHRGLDLSASANLAADAGATIKGAADASLGGDAAVSLAASAAFPLDLFHQCGIVVQFAAQAEAAAWVRLDVDLTVEEFLGRLRAAHSGGPMAQLVETFIMHLGVSAGVWASASASAEAHAEAILSGTLIPLSDGSTPGFTFSCGYGYGFGLGCGATMIASLDLDDPTALFNTMADQIAALVQQKLRQIIAGLPASDQALANKALPYLGFALPLATRGLFQMGSSLAPSSSGTGSDAAQQTAGGFVREVQEFLSRGLVDLAVEEINSLLDQARQYVQNLAADELQAVANVLQNLKAALHAYDNAPKDSIGDWATAVTSLLPSLWDVASSPLASGVTGNGWQENTALLWSGVEMARAVNDWMNDSGQNPFTADTVVDVPNNSGLAAYIAGRISKPAGSALTLEDLVSFVLAGDRETRILALLPDSLGEILRWLQNTIGHYASKPLLAIVFEDLASLDGDAATTLMPLLAQALQDAVNDQIEPQLLQRLGSDPDFAEITQRVLQPSLQALAQILIPALGTLADKSLDDDEVRVLREQISAVLMQFLAGFTLTAVDIISAEAFSQGAGLARSLATDVRNSGVDSVMNGVATALAILNPIFLFTPTGDDIANILDMAATVMDQWNNDNRVPVLNALEKLLALGLTTGTGLDQIYGLAACPDTPSDQGTLISVLMTLLQSSWDILLTIVEQAVYILAQHFIIMGKEIMRAVEAAAKGIIDAIESAVQWLAQQISALEQKLQELAGEIAQAALDALAAVGNIAGQALALEDSIIQDVHDYGWGLVMDMIDAMDVDYDFIVNAARDIYDTLFDAARDVVEAPLWILQDLGNQANSIAQQLSANGGLTSDNVRALLRNAINNAVGGDLSITIDVSFWVASFKHTFVIPGGDIISIVADALLGDGTISGHIDDLVNAISNGQTAQAQHDLTNQTLQGDLDQQQAQQQQASIITGQALSISIGGVTEGASYDEQASITIDIGGANLNYVNTVMGVPPRVKLYINSTEVVYAPGDWSTSADGIAYQTTAVASSVTLRSAPLWGGSQAVRLARGNTLSTRHDNRGMLVLEGVHKPMTATPRIHHTTPTLLATLPQGRYPSAQEAAQGHLWTAGGGLLDVSAGLALHLTLFQTGLNTVQVLAVDGQGQQQQASCHFYLRSTAGLPAAPARYIGIWSADAGVSTLQQFNDFGSLASTWQSRLEQGQALTSLDVFTSGGKTVWSGVWNAGSQPQALYMTSDWNDFQAQVATQLAGGMRLTDLAVTFDGGNTLWTGLWEPGSNIQHLEIFSSWDALATRWQDYGNQGLRLCNLKTWNDGSRQQWIGVWRAGNDGHALYAHSDPANFAGFWQQSQQGGLRLVDLCTWFEGDVRVWSGIWREGTDRSPGLTTQTAAQVTSRNSDFAARQQQMRRVVGFAWQNRGS